MGKPPRGDAVASASGKRSRQEIANAQSASKKLLSNNRYAILENGDEPEIKKKEKLPPFFVKGFPPGLRENIEYYIEKGFLKCTMRLCSEGIMLMVPARKDYKAVEVLLKQKKWEYFSHDIEEDKPLKVVVRGLPDMEIAALSDELKKNGLRPSQVFRMNRHDASRKYRDQLYLVHLERNTTCLKDLQCIRALFHIVVKWERYQPRPRNVTQCSNCLMFGHGTKNCHMAHRCNECGKQHEPEECESMENADPQCANCGAAHRATSKSCPKRAEFMEIRKRASTQNQPGRKKVPARNEQNFPAISQRRPIPILPPLPLNNRLAAAAASVPPTAEVPNHPANPSRQSYAATVSSPPPGLSWRRDDAPPSHENEELLTTEELITIMAEAIIIKRSCRTRTEQILAASRFIDNYGP